MKLLLVGMIVVGTVLAQAPLTPAEQDALAVRHLPAESSNLNAVLGSIIAILTLIAGILQQLNRKNSAVADVLIRSIERSGNNAVKNMVSKESKEEGNTAFLHKKVQTVVDSMAGATPTDAFRKQPDPPASPDAGSRSG